ncbi:MAG: glycosyltransferase, partial [Chroococcales cyanobacterium]
MTFPISLIITTYNRQQYLSCAIESILQQTQRHFELLIWDDGSTDASLEIAYQYASQDSRVRVVSAPHLGRGQALKKAIAATQGKYIGWVDSDDWLAPTALAETADFLNRHPPVGMVYTDYFDIDPNGNTIGYGQRCSIPYSPAKLLSFFMTFHFRLIRRSVYDAVGGIRAAFETAEDYDLCLRLSEVTEIGRIHQPLYFYRHHSQNISTQQDQKQRLRSHAAALEALSRRNSAPSLSPSLMPISVQRSNWHLRSPLLLWERGVKKGRKEVPLGKGDLGGSSLREMLNFSSVQKLTQYALPSLVAIAFSFEPAIAQSITPASDGTNTQVIQDGTQFNIQGGTLSSDGNNLFHSFQQFGLNPNEVANFLSNPQIQNILGRVIGGDASYINGLIQVSGGNSNLFLMNPAGMVFGNNAQLNVPAAFSATTATGIAFENGIFNAFGTNDYTNLTGNPTAFNFNTSQPGSIVNNGNLEVAPEQNLSLIGGTVVNVGTLKAPGGNITVTAVPGSSRVRFTPEGHLLSLELELPTDSNGNLIPITPQILPELLVGSPTNTGLTVDANNSVYTASGTQLPTNPGVAVSNGILNASSSNIGGNVHVFGQQVGLVDNAQVNVSGELGGGIALIGGDFQGKGTVPNAQTTYIGQNAEINADAITEGNGGEVIIWSDDTTRFYGNISATGGANSGDGGFVEVSGKQNLTFQGFVDTAAPNGNWGQLLLDPDFLTIVDSAAGTGDLDTNLSEDSFIASGDGVSSNTVSWGQIIAQGNVDITLQATNDITIENITGVVSGTDSLIELPLTTGTLTIESFFGSISFQDSTDTIRTQGGNLSFIAGNQLSLGNLETNGGNIFLDLFSTSSVGNLSTGVLNTSSTTGAGGNILIEAYGYYGDPITISVDNINTSSSSPSGDNGGTVEIFALAESFETSSLTESKVTINGDILTTSATGSGGDVTIEADTSSSSGDVKSSISVSGNIDTSATSGNAGNIRLDSLSEASTFGSPTAESDIKTANIIATSDIGNGGNVDLNSYAKSSSIIIGTIITGDINTSSLSGTGGNISFTSQYDPGEGSIVYSDLGQILLLEENRTFNAGTGSITFDNVELNLEGNDLTLTGDEINLDVSKSKKVYGSGNLILQPGTASQSIQLGSTDAGDPAILELSTAELALLENGFASITIGSEMGEGTVTLADNLTFNDPIILRSPLGIGQINTAGFGITGNDNATITLIANESINADTISNPGRAIALQSNEVNFNAGSGSIIGGTLFIFPSSDTQNINIGNASDAGINSLDLLTSDINAIASGFTSITIGEVTNLGTITLFESVTDSGLTPFTSPVILAGGSTLVGANVNSTWELTGVDSGNLNSIFSNGFTFNSIENLTGGTANDTFQINDGFSLSGNLNAGDGNDTLDYSTYTTENVTIDLSNQVATGIDGIVSNFENFVANSSLNNTLIGENTSSDWTVSSLNSGTVNGSSFSNFQNLQGGSANDTFTLTGGTVSNINGSGGDNTLVGDNTNNTFNITGTNSGDVNGIAFTSIQNLTGGSANDTFTLTGGTVSTINGSGGDNTLVGDNTNNT